MNDQFPLLVLYLCQLSTIALPQRSKNNLTDVVQLDVVISKDLTRGFLSRQISTKLNVSMILLIILIDLYFNLTSDLSTSLLVKGQLKSPPHTNEALSPHSKVRNNYLKCVKYNT